MSSGGVITSETTVAERRISKSIMKQPYVFWTLLFCWAVELTLGEIFHMLNVIALWLLPLCLCYKTSHYGARKCLEYGEFKAKMIKKNIINATGDLEVQFKFS